MFFRHTAVSVLLACGMSLHGDIPALTRDPDGMTVWVDAEEALTHDGFLRPQLYAPYFIEKFRANARQNPKGVTRDDCRVYFTSTSDHFKATNTLEDLSRNATTIVSGTVVAIRQGIFGTTPGSLLQLSAEYLKGDPYPETFLFYPYARIETAEGFLCAKPVGDFSVPRLGDRFLIFSMSSPTVRDGRAFLHVNLARESVHAPAKERPRLPMALRIYAAEPKPFDAVKRDVMQSLRPNDRAR